MMEFPTNLGYTKRLECRTKGCLYSKERLMERPGLLVTLLTLVFHGEIILNAILIVINGDIQFSIKKMYISDTFAFH